MHTGASRDPAGRWVVSWPTRWFSIVPCPPRPLGQVGMARVDRAARVAKGRRGDWRPTAAARLAAPVLHDDRAIDLCVGTTAADPLIPNEPPMAAADPSVRVGTKKTCCPLPDEPPLNFCVSELTLLISQSRLAFDRVAMGDGGGVPL